jgi:ribonuclease P protein component
VAARIPRLKRRSEFLRVAGKGRKWAMPGVVVQALRRSEEDPPIRVGFTASKKVGGSVERNRARRRLRAAADALLPLEAKPGHDYVLIARAETVTRPYGALIEDLRVALRRLAQPSGRKSRPDGSAG